MADEKKAEYTPSNATENLKAFHDQEKEREKAGKKGLDLPEPYQPPGVTRTDLEPREYQKLDAATEQAYVGVDPIYQNYASDTDKPSLPTEGPESENWKKVVGPVKKAGAKKEEAKDESPSTSSPSTPVKKAEPSSTAAKKAEAPAAPGK